MGVCFTFRPKSYQTGPESGDRSFCRTTALQFPIVSTAPSAKRNPDPELLARLARLGVGLGPAGIVAPPPPEHRGASSGAVPPRNGRFSARSARSALPDERPLSPESDGQSPAVLPIEEAVPGYGWSGSIGDCWVSAERRPTDDLHAGERFDGALGACTTSLAALSANVAVAGMDVANTAFLDTETTGLGIAAGTYAFLIGVGRFVGGHYELRQFFMRHPGEEPAQLQAVAEWLAGCGSIVTFNGRSFDLPLLEARYRYNRLESPFRDLVHLDLLPAARRMWRRRLPSCALVALERDVFGLTRHDDVPGWLIPERYWRYQREGDARPLVGIFHHNALDIYTMVSLVTRLAQSYRTPDETIDHSNDWLSLARSYEAAGEFERATAACESALAKGLTPIDADEAYWRLSMIARRTGDWDRAVTLWQQLSDEFPPRRLYPFEELAKYYEHRIGEADITRALETCLTALDLVMAGHLRPRRGRRLALKELEHRIARLRRKAAKAAG